MIELVAPDDAELLIAAMPAGAGSAAGAVLAPNHCIKGGCCAALFSAVFLEVDGSHSFRKPMLVAISYPILSSNTNVYICYP